MGPLDWTYRLARWALGSIFIYAGAAKLLEPEVFAVLIDAYGILPDRLVMPVAIGLPVMEVIAGTGLIFDVRASLSIITGLLFLFVIILGYGIRMKLDVDCGCFGPEDPEFKAFHNLRAPLYRDLAMLAAIALIYTLRCYRSIKPLGIKNLTKRRTEDAYD